MAVQNSKLIADRIIAVGGKFETHVNRVMYQVGQKLDKQVRLNISRTDYSLKELAKLDHPFATRHGKTGIHIYEPYWMVHTRTGDLLRAKEMFNIPADIRGDKLIAGAFVKLDGAKARHAEFVVFGTWKMIPRPVLLGSLMEIKDELFLHLKKHLRDLKFNFGATGQ